MKSYAIWCKKNSGENAILDIHINFWKIPRKARSLKGLFLSSSSMFLDFGFKISDIHLIDEIKIFLPYKVAKNNLLDLGEYFINHTNLIIGVFNEDYTIEIGTESKHIVINKGKSDEFIIYLLDIKNEECLIEEKYDGSLITIPIPETLKERRKPLYFRFRINSPEIKKMIKSIKASSIFESALAYTEVVDLRVNEKRLYDRSLSQQVKTEGEFNVRKIHFLLMTNAQDEVIALGKNPTSRQLEESIWSNYTGNEYNLESVFAYHWKDEKTSSHNSLVKLKIQRSSLRKALSYIATLGVITVTYNLITEPVKTYITDPFLKLLNKLFT